MDSRSHESDTLRGASRFSDYRRRSVYAMENHTLSLDEIRRELQGVKLEAAESESGEDPEQCWQEVASVTKQALDGSHRLDRDVVFNTAEDLLLLVSLLARKVQTEKMKASVSRTNLAEMERIWSSSKDRTDEHFTEVQELCSTMTDFVAKYHHLREKGLRKSVDVSKIVKALEDECQELDDALATVAKALKAHRAQDRELDRTLKTTRNSACLQSITPDELVNMKLQLQQLENKNGSLATEQTRLQRYVDHLDTRVKELEIHEDKTSTASPRRSLAKLLKKRDKLFSTIASERAKYESRLAQAEKDAVKFGEYVEFLSFRVAAGQ